MKAWLALLLVGLTLSSGVYGASPVQAERFPDPEMSARYQSLIEEFRCPKCLNTNLKGSDSPIAVDLRRAVARLLRENSSDQQVRDYLQARYGDFVLYNPPFKPSTYVLWLGPLVFLLLALLVVWRTVGRAKHAEVQTLDEAALAKVLATPDVGVKQRTDRQATRQNDGEPT